MLKIPSGFQITSTQNGQSYTFINFFSTLGSSWKSPSWLWATSCLLHSHPGTRSFNFLPSSDHLKSYLVLIVGHPGLLVPWSPGNFGWLALLAPLPLDLDLTTIFAAGKAAKCPIKGSHTHPQSRDQKIQKMLGFSGKSDAISSEILPILNNVN